VFSSSVYFEKFSYLHNFCTSSWFLSISECIFDHAITFRWRAWLN
jgi:hypothetical protein